jgi:hypothetical protein
MNTADRALSRPISASSCSATLCAWASMPGSKENFTAFLA